MESRKATLEREIKAHNVVRKALESKERTFLHQLVILSLRNLTVGAGSADVRQAVADVFFTIMVRDVDLLDVGEGSWVTLLLYVDSTNPYKQH